MKQVGSAFDLRDALAIIGWLMLTVGFVLMWLPLGLIVPGGLLFWLAVRPFAQSGGGMNGNPR